MYYNAFQAQKIGKKVLALVLALMMVVSLMVSANAAVTFADAADINPQYQEAVEVLQTLGIMQGIPTEVPATEEGAEPTTVNNFQPKTNLTRAQFAVILFKLATGDDGDEATYEMYKTQNIYSDVPSTNYAVAHINYLNKIDAMHGIGGGKFDPDREVTGYEVVQGLLQAIGYGKRGEFGDSWEDAKLVTAAFGTSKHITTGLGIDIKSVINREQLAALLFNVLTRPEAYKVTAVSADGTHYIEDDTPDARVTIGETNWELHLYTRSSGSKYPSDKEINVSLDPFGRPQNPKWVARVDGEIKLIGTENKALIEYYEGPVTRQKLTNDFYSLYAFKDGYANTEYYVDGLQVEDPWTYVKGVHNSSEYDTIGGIGVTVEVYMMADNYVAIDKDLVNEEWLRTLGDTNIGGNGDKGTWPRMRVVIVHNYAAKLTTSMMIDGNTAASSDDYIEVPYDEVTLYKCDVCGKTHYDTTAPKTVRVSISNNDKYAVGDVVYFDVANSYNKSGKLIHTVIHDTNLTETDGCVVTGVVDAIDPAQKYVRIKDMPENNSRVAPGGALYYNYFMLNTAKVEYRGDSVKKTADTQTVYLEPKNKQFAALIVTEQEDPTYAAGTYYYVEQVEARIGRDAVLFNDSQVIVLAKMMDVVTHSEVTKELSAKIDGGKIISIAGHLLDKPIDIKNTIMKSDDYDGHWYYDDLEDVVIYDMKKDQHYVDVGRYDVLDNDTVENTADDVSIDNKFLAEVGGLYWDKVEGKFTHVDPAHPVTVRLYDYLDLGVDVTRWYYYAVGNKLVKDDAGNPIIFAVVEYPDGTEKTVIWDRYKKYGPDSGSLPNGEVGSAKEEYTGSNNTATEENSTSGKHIYVVNDLENLSHQYREIPGFDPDKITVAANALKETNYYRVELGTLGKQFVIYNEGNKTFDYDVTQKQKDCYAYDDDASECYKITSGIFAVNETSSRVYIDGQHSLTNTKCYHIQKDIPDHFADEHKGKVYAADVDTTVLVTESTQVIAYEKLYTYYYETEADGNTTHLDPVTGKPVKDDPEWDFTGLKYIDTYSYNEFERFGIKDFGIKDTDPEVLVVYYNDQNGTKTAKYIIVIADEDEGSKAIEHNTYYGIYNGFTEVSETQIKIDLLNPHTGTVTPMTVSKSAVAKLLPGGLKDSIRYIGYVFGVKADGSVTLMDEPLKPIFANYNTIVTKDDAGNQHVQTLKDPKYIYVGHDGGFYITDVTDHASDFIDIYRDGIRVAVYNNGDAAQTNTVVIWAEDIVEGYKDGHPDYGTIDVNWDWNTHGDPNWQPAD